MPLPPELLVFLVSTLPIIELDGGVILGHFLRLPLEASVFWAIIGNMIPVFLILWLLEPVSKFLMKHSGFFHMIFTKIFEHTHKRHSRYMERIGAMFLIIFIAIPFPLTGAYTATLVCYLFRVPYWKTVIINFLGIVGGAIIIALGIQSVTHLPAALQILFPQN